MNIIVIGIISLLSVLIAKIVINVSLLYITYKKRYGNQIVFKFYPLLGLFYFIEDSFKKHGESFRFLQDIMKNSPQAKAVLFLSGVENVLVILDHNWNKEFFMNSNGFKKFKYCFSIDILFRDGLVLAEQEFWKNSRKFLNKAFHFQSIKDKMEIMKDSAKLFANQIPELEKNHQIINLPREIKLISTFAVCKTFFGQTSYNQIEKCNNKTFHDELIDAVDQAYYYSMTKYFLTKVMLLGTQRASIMFNTSYEKRIINRYNNLKNIALNFIQNRKQEMEKCNLTQYEPETVIDLYLKQMIIDERSGQQIDCNSRITFELIYSQFFTFFFAGTDSTSLSITLALYYFSRYPEIKQRVIEEMKKNIPNSFDQVTFDHINKLDYTTKCIKEVLRLHPPLQYLFPRQIDQPTQIGEMYFEKDLLVASNLINCNKFDNFYQFNPDRFDENFTVDTYDYIPFSAGQRNCIGQHYAMTESKVFLTYILMNYDIQPVKDYVLRMKQTLIINPENPYMISLKKITK